MPTTFLTTRLDSRSLSPAMQPVWFNSTNSDYASAILSRFDCYSLSLSSQVVSLNSTNPDSVAVFLSRLDARALLFGLQSLSWQSVLYGRSACSTIRFASLPVQSIVKFNRFDTVGFDPFARFALLFDSNRPGIVATRALFDQINRELCTTALALRFDLRQTTTAGTTAFFDAIRLDDLTVRSLGRFESSKSASVRSPAYFSSNNLDIAVRLPARFNWYIDRKTAIPARFDSIADRFRQSLLFARWSKEQLYQIVLFNRFGPGFRWNNERLPIAFDANKNYFSRETNRFESFVKSLWKPIARNIITGEIHHLGTIDADSPNRSLVIDLPDGDYEITTLTSGLYWQDARDLGSVLVRIGGEEPLSPLPQVIDLRSTIKNSIRIVQWSSTKSEVADCVFGLWFGEQSPDTNRPPDSTVWYSNTMSEYQYQYSQTGPVFVKVASIRTGETQEIGKASELFLDWNNTPPNQPDDSVVQNKETQ